MNEALFRYFEPLCPTCGGTGRSTAQPVVDPTALVKTLEDFLRNKEEAENGEPPPPRDNGKPET